MYVEDIRLVYRCGKDDEFVFGLFAEDKIAELHADSWPDRLKDRMVDMQFTAFESAMRSQYPDADDCIVMAGSVKAGRVYVYGNGKGYRILYISLLPAFRGMGTGGRILKRIVSKADATRLPVCLEVDKVNPAVRLYRRFGFEIYTESAMKYFMKYVPQLPVPQSFVQAFQ